MAKEVYNTKARREITEYLIDNKHKTVAASDILAFLKQKGIFANLTTVYRYLNKLVEEQAIIKITDESGKKSLYQLVSEENDCENHLHIQCVKCGRLIHLDCDIIAELRTHLDSDHGFDLQCAGSILYGLCDVCKE